MRNHCSPGVLTVPLIPIQLPTFDGTVRVSPEFETLFNQLIHNVSLYDVRKLYYLKTYVITGDDIILRERKLILKSLSVI